MARPDAKGRLPVQGSRPDAMTQAAKPGQSRSSVAELLALSDERDLWLRRVYDAWRDGYQAGHADGVRPAGSAGPGSLKPSGPPSLRPWWSAGRRTPSWNAAAGDQTDASASASPAPVSTRGGAHERATEGY